MVAGTDDCRQCARVCVCVCVFTGVDEVEDAAEAGVVGLLMVGVELEDEIGRRRVEPALSERRQRVVAAQLVVPLVLLVHLRSLQVQEQTHEVRAPGRNRTPHIHMFVVDVCGTTLAVSIPSHSHEVISISTHLRSNISFRFSLY